MARKRRVHSGKTVARSYHEAASGPTSAAIGCATRYGLILIVPVLLVRECAVRFTAHVPGATLLGSRKITWVKIEPGVVRTSSAVRL